MGHRQPDERLLPRLESVIDRKDRVRYFYVGRYEGLDKIAAAGRQIMCAADCKNWKNSPKGFSDKIKSHLISQVGFDLSNANTFLTMCRARICASW